MLLPIVKEHSGMSAEKMEELMNVNYEKWSYEVITNSIKGIEERNLLDKWKADSGFGRNVFSAQQKIEEVLIKWVNSLNSVICSSFRQI